MEAWKLRLKQAREAKGLNKTTFARLVGVSNATVTDWEKSAGDGGIKELSAPSLAKIYEVLGVDLYWLLSGKRGAMSDGNSNGVKDAGHGGKVPDESVESILRRTAELIDTYRLATPADRERIDSLMRRVRRRFVNVDQAKPSAS